MRGAKIAGAMLTGLLTASGCATPATDGSPSQVRGTAGPVAWEVTDMGQLVSLGGDRMLWSYVVVLRETAGTSIQFERVEETGYVAGRGGRGGGQIIGGGPTSTPFRRSLAANSELRVPLSDHFGWTSSGQFGGAATLDTLTVERRFIGADAQGRPITVGVRVQLDRSVGRRTTPLATAGPLPPPTTLTAADLAGLAGTWRGSYRINLGQGRNEFDIPLEASIRSDGSVELAEYDPVTRRSRATLSVRDGRLAYTAGNNSGTFDLHEGGGKRVLFGRISSPREGGTVSLTVRLEITAPTAR